MEEGYATAAHEVPWNLDRIDQRSDTLDGSYSPEGTGEGVDVYIFDTGIHYTHNEFEGRASYGGYDAIDALTGSDKRGLDCNSHGTHCAGTVGGKTFGVAKKASLYSIRVLGCTGSGAISGIIKGLDPRDGVKIKITKSSDLDVTGCSQSSRQAQQFYYSYR